MGDPYLRCINNVPTIPGYPPYNVTIYVDGKPIVDLKYKQVSDYIPIDGSNKRYKIGLKSLNPSIIPLYKVKLTNGSHFTMIVTGSVKDESTIKSHIYPDTLECVHSDYSNIRIIHSAYNVPPLDCYIGNKIIPNIDFTEHGNPQYLNIRSTTLSILAKQYNTHIQLIAPIMLNTYSSNVYTLLVTGTLEDEVTFIILTDTEGLCTPQIHSQTSTSTEDSIN